MTQPEPLLEYRLTFGIQYEHEQHPLFPAAHPDGWVAVMAPDYDTARNLVIDRLGRQWAFLYYPGELDLLGDHFPRGEVDRWSTAGQPAPLVPSPWPAPAGGESRG